MGKGSKILIADRNNNVCTLLRRVLESEGYQVQIARNGKEVLVVTNTDEALGLLVTALDLPLVGGTEVLERLRNRIPPLPIIIHSSQVDLSRRLAADGPYSFVEKGENLDILLDVINNALANQKHPDSTHRKRNV